MIEHLLLCIFLFQAIEANGGHGVGKPRLHPTTPPPQRKWMTLTGGQPEIVARGGYSGFFPDSSLFAYDLAADLSLPGVILYCNLHFTKDNEGFCVQQINLQNTTNIGQFDPKGAKTYNINGQQIRGYFGLDYPANIIYENVTLSQNNYIRQPVFDGLPIQGPFQLREDKNGKPTRLWINVEYDLFYKEHNINAETYLLQLKPLPEFISSPEIGFLKAIGPKVGMAKTKLIFTFLGEKALEPTTGETYGSLIKKLPTIKSFASGILVPKEYIWPINKARYLEPATTLVQDAHRAGLSVYASGFANDNFLSYNYSYDPAREYKHFIDGPQFSVDGFLSEFPSTASEAIGCLPHNKNASRVIKTLIISHNGASGDYPGSSDLAYKKAIEDGADIIDCTVQMSKDGIAFCLDRPDLMKTTTAVTSFMDKSSNIPEIQNTDGIFSFDLTWDEIQSTKPQIESYFEGELNRNPGSKNGGKFVTLSEFLELAKTKKVPGVLVSIKYAAYLASEKGLDIVDTVSKALSNATLDKQSTQKVLILSDDTSVLSKFEDIPNYQRVLYFEKSVGGAPNQVAQEVKKYADAVMVHRDAIVVASENFAFNFTKTLPAMHAANISVYVGILKNEFQNFIFDYLSDPYVELSTFISLKVDGVITDYPATANSFMRSSCTTKGSPYIIPPMKPGFLFEARPVAEPPLLSTEDLVDPPLPPVDKNAAAADDDNSSPDSSSSSDSANKNSNRASGPAGSDSSTDSITIDVTAQGLLCALVLGLLTIIHI